MPLLVAFAGATSGTWTVEHHRNICGPPLPEVSHVSVIEGAAASGSDDGAAWVLRGVTSHERYMTRGERETLVLRQETLARPSSTCAALIAITKSDAWWDLAQDERRQILEARSRHIAIGLEHLPAIARRLHHGRDLSEAFDFLTWFEFAPEDGGSFDDVTERLRATEEWTYVEREVDLRLTR